MLNKMLKKMKEHENIVVFIAILLVSCIICFPFLKFHTVPDTYNVLAQKHAYASVFFRDGRFISASYILMEKFLNIPVEVLSIISNICSIIFQSLCVYIIYGAITQKEDKPITKMIYLIGAYIMVFNPLAIEHLGYFECGIMCLGKLMCTLASKILIKDNKIIVPTLLMMTAAICYQGILNVFIAVSLLLLVLEKNQTIKQKAKKVFEIGIVCIITFVTIMIAIKIVYYAVGMTRRNLPINILEDIIQTIKMTIDVLVLKTWNYIPKYLIISVITITIILLFIYKKPKRVIDYVVIVILTTLSCVIPMAVLKGVTSARTVSSVGAILRNIDYYVRE